MKTAQQWHDYLLEQMSRPPDFCFCQASVDDIAAIQADALRSASEALLQCANKVDPEASKEEG